MSHRRYPNYPDDADYTTNSPSYYDDLARKNVLIKELAERIWGYEETLKLSLEEIAQRFISWDAKIAGFDGDVNELLKKWMSDGTFDHIINETIFSSKANQADLMVERARIDAFIALSAGSTTGDAELLDVRLGAEGEKYPTAGGSVRGQFNELNKELDNFLVTTKGKQMLNRATNVDGFFGTVNAAYKTTDFIKTTIGTRLNVYRWDKHDEINANAWGIETYDINKNKIARIQLATLANFYDNTNASYVKISADNSYWSLIAVEEVTKTITALTPYTPPVYSIKSTVQVPSVEFNIPNVLNGKSLITLGDSITAGAGVTDKTKAWGSLIALRNGMTYKNAGISASTMGASVDGSNSNASYKTNRHLEITGYNYATIWFGWNDYHFSALGTVGSTNTDTTLGAFYATLNHLVRQAVETKVGVIIPYLWDYGTTPPRGYTIMQLINGIKQTCDLFGIPYLDINKYNFLPSWGSDYPNDSLYYVKWDARQLIYTSDTLHPNVKGNAYLSTIIENFLRSL